MKNNYVLNINFTKNNIITTLSNIKIKNNITSVELLHTISSGSCGFKNSQKKTPFACITVISKITLFINKYKIKHLVIKFKGNFLYNKITLNTIFKLKTFNIDTLIEQSTLSYNGCLKSKNTKLILNEYLY